VAELLVSDREVADKLDEARFFINLAAGLVFFVAGILVQKYALGP
jgi:hypothetical protein